MNLMEIELIQQESDETWVIDCFAYTIPCISILLCRKSVLTSLNTKKADQPTPEFRYQRSLINVRTTCKWSIVDHNKGFNQNNTLYLKKKCA